MYRVEVEYHVKLVDYIADDDTPKIIEQPTDVLKQEMQNNMSEFLDDDVVSERGEIVVECTSFECTKCEEKKDGEE